MKQNPTAGEVWAASDELETTTATLLGRLVFAFSRLDVALGLCLVWAGDGRQIGALTPRVTAMTFHKKLDQLAELVEAKFVAGSKKRSGWARWIEDAHKTRALRNQLTHGRWGVDPYTDDAINVIGLPTSPNQHEIRYSPKALSDAVIEAIQLQTKLSQLREQWPV